MGRTALLAAKIMKGLRIILIAIAILISIGIYLYRPKGHSMIVRGDSSTKQLTSLDTMEAGKQTNYFAWSPTQEADSVKKFVISGELYRSMLGPSFYDYPNHKYRINAPKSATIELYFKDGAVFMFTTMPDADYEMVIN
jgi:hypothetical protein